MTAWIPRFAAIVGVPGVAGEPLAEPPSEDRSAEAAHLPTR
ncbi:MULTISPECIES: hypothetical protein [unclassified Micromonospora]